MPYFSVAPVGVRGLREHERLGDGRSSRLVRAPGLANPATPLYLVRGNPCVNLFFIAGQLFHLTQGELMNTVFGNSLVGRLYLAA